MIGSDHRVLELSSSCDPRLPLANHAFEQSSAQEKQGHWRLDELVEKSERLRLSAAPARKPPVPAAKRRSSAAPRFALADGPRRQLRQSFMAARSTCDHG
jgi:hypothetical protein